MRLVKSESKYNNLNDIGSGNLVLGDQSIFTYDSFDLSGLDSKIEKLKDQERSESFFALPDAIQAKVAEKAAFNKGAQVIYLANMIDCFTKHNRDKYTE